MKLIKPQLIKVYPEVRLGEIYVIENFRCIYVTNQKCGCSTIKLYLNRVYSGDYSFDKTDIHRNRLVPPPNIIGWSKIHKLVNDGAFGFTFVRDPWARAASGYRDKMSRPNWRSEINEILGRESSKKELSFEDFLIAISSQNEREMNPHWRPQHINIMYDEIEYDLIGRLENIDQDMSKIQKETGMPSIPMTHKNKSKDRLDVPDTKRNRALVEQIYARDYELLGY